ALPVIPHLDYFLIMRLFASSRPAAAFFGIALWAIVCSAAAQRNPQRPAPDVIIFTNGDQLSGTLERGVGNSITFKSDMAGEITVSLDKVKELRSSGSFAVLRKDVPPTRTNVVPGTIVYQNKELSLLAPLGTPETIPEAKVAYIIDQS